MGMANLIDRDVLMAQLEDRQAFLVKEWGYRDHYTRGFEEAVDKVENAPAVYAVEVTRCKDCRHFVQGEPYDPCECMKWKVKFGVAYTEPDGYCHKAERKDND